MILQPLLIIRVASLVIGVGLYWMLSNEDYKKRAIERYTSIMTTWLLLFIGSKLVTQWSLLVDYPLSVLAYPSGAEEFYMATAAIVLLEWRNRKINEPYAHAYIWMLSTSFVSFAISAQLVLGQGHGVDVTFMFVFFLFVFIVRKYVWGLVLFTGLAAVVGFFYHTPALMGYRIDAWFYLGIFVMILLFVLYGKGYGKRRIDVMK